MSAAYVAHNVNEKPRTGDVIISENVDFEGLLLSDRVLKGLKSAGFERPSPIQLKAIPLGRCGLDLIVQAKSGTGKTCVFSVVALENIQLDSSALQAIVLAPTREIAIQIWDVINSIGKAIPSLKCHTFIGGMPVQEDRQKLKKCHIGVGTPGRIKQLIESGIMNVDSVRMFILDEADKLLEESFQVQINWIYSSLPDNKQMLALSATYPEYLAQHLTAYMRNPTFLRLNITDPALLGIKQFFKTVSYHPMPNKLFESKVQAVVELLSSVNFQQCLIFSNLQTRAQNMADTLTSLGWPTACIAGSHEQKDRNEAMAKLKTYKCRVLISTDLTSRGIDADKVNMVINLDVPRDHETYLHRIGRAGRFGSFGAAITIISIGQEQSDLQAVEKKCNTHINPIPGTIPADLCKSTVQIRLDDVVSSEQIITNKTATSKLYTESLQKSTNQNGDIDSASGQELFKQIKSEHDEINGCNIYLKGSDDHDNSNENKSTNLQTGKPEDLSEHFNGSVKSHKGDNSNSTEIEQKREGGNEKSGQISDLSQIQRQKSEDDLRKIELSVSDLSIERNLEKASEIKSCKIVGKCDILEDSGFHNTEKLSNLNDLTVITNRPKESSESDVEKDLTGGKKVSVTDPQTGFSRFDATENGLTNNLQKSTVVEQIQPSQLSCNGNIDRNIRVIIPTFRESIGYQKLHNPCTYEQAVQNFEKSRETSSYKDRKLPLPRTPKRDINPKQRQELLKSISMFLKCNSYPDELLAENSGENLVKNDVINTKSQTSIKEQHNQMPLKDEYKSGVVSDVNVSDLDRRRSQSLATLASDKKINDDSIVNKDTIQLPKTIMRKSYKAFSLGTFCNDLKTCHNEMNKETQNEIESRVFIENAAKKVDENIFEKQLDILNFRDDDSLSSSSSDSEDFSETENDSEEKEEDSYYENYQEPYRSSQNINHHNFGSADRTNNAWIQNGANYFLPDSYWQCYHHTHYNSPYYTGYPWHRYYGYPSPWQYSYHNLCNMPHSRFTEKLQENLEMQYEYMKLMLQK